MTKKKKRQSPSRQKYEDAKPTVSFRLPKALKEQLIGHLADAGQTYTEYTESMLDKEGALAKERVDALVAKRFGKFVANLHMTNELLWQVLCTCIGEGLPIFCPRCEHKGEYRLFPAWCDEIGEDGNRETEVPTWKCPRCGWYLDVYGRIDPQSIRWHDPESAKQAIQEKPQVKKQSLPLKSRNKKK